MKRRAVEDDALRALREAAVSRAGAQFTGGAPWATPVARSPSRGSATTADGPELRRHDAVRGAPRAGATRVRLDLHVLQQPATRKFLHSTDGGVRSDAQAAAPTQWPSTSVTSGAGASTLAAFDAEAVRRAKALLAAFGFDDVASVACTRRESHATTHTGKVREPRAGLLSCAVG